MLYYTECYYYILLIRLPPFSKTTVPNSSLNIEDMQENYLKIMCLMICYVISNRIVSF